MTTNIKMHLADIVKALQTGEHGILPVEALNSASEQWADFWPELKTHMLECIKDLTSLSEEQDNLLFYGVLLAAQQCEYEAYPLLLRIFDNTDDYDGDLERIFGEVIINLLPSIFYILGKDDHQQLNELICSHASGMFVKSSALTTMTAKHESGQLSREKLVTLVRQWLDSVFIANLEVSEHFLSAVCILCIDCNLIEFKQALLDLAHNDKLDPMYFSPMEIEDWNHSGLSLIESGGIKEEFNVVSEMSTWAGFNDDNMPYTEDDWINYDTGDYADYALSVPYIAPPKIGRNEPCICGSGKKYKKCCL